MIKMLNSTSILSYEKCILVFLRLFFFGFLLMGCSTNAKNEPYNDIRNPRFSPDGKKMVFDIANSSFGEGIRIYLYDLESKELSSYKAPDGQNFRMASFSCDGQKLAFITAPIKDHNKTYNAQRQDIMLNYQVATMNINGSNMRVLTSDQGLKLFPAFSHKGDKIIFSKSGKIRNEGATPAMDYDLWEYDLNSKQEYLFMGKAFRFYQLGYSTYFNDDKTVLLAGYMPLDNAQGNIEIFDYAKKTNRSSIYIVERGQIKLEMPILMEFNSSSEATLDKDENIYFYADSKEDGGKIRKLEKNQQFQKWPFPVKGAGTSKGMSVAHDGQYIAYSFTSKTSQLMLLNTNTGEWSEILLPTTVKEIHVTANKGVN